MQNNDYAKIPNHSITYKISNKKPNRDITPSRPWQLTFVLEVKHADHSIRSKQNPWLHNNGF